MLVSVDDAHWADEESLRFLDYLAHRVDGLPVAMLVAGRPAEGPAAAEGASGLWGRVAAWPAALASRRGRSASARWGSWSVCARVDYHVPGGVVRILGLADLGRRQSAYDDCYVEGKDNQIDIVLAGDERAVRRITDGGDPRRRALRPVLQPRRAGHRSYAQRALHGTRPHQAQPVRDALRDPRNFTYVRPR